ncbi:ATP-binding protein [Simiduia sp. 21SJ11W-1]|uniref:sensor histidine kinase n=1 Tax=Simiduia sp. 21SJ11W-1 TaxID=2909669 RepID=UPI00209ED86D|nr:ATP-binding protein [Simiduia sp. 21SJ11W-1]UTA48446.1 ATP-binding protein [Simiduia sp. 21SJ11W-1]
MAFKRFSLVLTLRLTLVLLSLLAFTWLLFQPGYYATCALVLAAVILQCWAIVRFVGRTNNELARFLGAARYADFNQQFDLNNQGAGFDELGTTFTDILARIRAERSEQEQELRHLRALLEHVPVPLISVFNDGSITLWNNAARRLFGTVPVVNTTQLEQFGQTFAAQLHTLPVGERRVVKCVVDDIEHQLIVTAAQLRISATTEKLISLQDIQSELEGAQLQAWQDLVRVLTHEIMNSITPVSSLAHTASSLARELQEEINQENIDDLQQAVDTLARRAENLLGFVSSYRQMTRLPTPQKQRCSISELLTHIRALMAPEAAAAKVQLQCHTEPSSLEAVLDRDMIEQVIINLVKNALHALAGHASASLTLKAHLSKRGRAVIQVADNGPGIADNIADKIFVPFFTTKTEGSGVGLALSRQIMLAHGGTLTVHATPGGGATFNLNF